MNRVGFFFAAAFFTLLSSTTAPAQVSLTTFGSPASQNFDGIGNSATATLPSGWRVDSVAASPTTNYASATTATTQAAGTTGTGAVNGSSTGGTYNFANGVTATSTDRAVGWLSSGGFTSPRQLFVQLTNNTGVTLTSLVITYDIEKYRSGSRAFDINFFSSTDGSTWTARPAGDQSYAADANNTTVFNPPSTTSKSVTISGLSVPNGGNFFLRWSYTGVGGSTNGQGLGIDNFTVTAPSSSLMFRSVTSGNWNSPATWEMSTDGVTWVPATSTPTSASGSITVRSPHTVTVTASVDADELTINGGGVVSVNNGVTFTVADGPGTDLTADGTLATAGGVANGGQILVNNTFQLNAGGFISAPPTYAAGSLLRYNTGGTYGRFNEWTSTSGAGYPFNVQLSNNTTLEVGANGGTATARQIAGSLTVDAGSHFQMAGANPMTQPVTVTGGVIVNGTLTLSTALGGDFKLGGDWTRGASSTFIRNNRAVFFIGSTAQTVTINGGGVETFAYLVVDKPAGDLTLSSSPPTSVVIDSPSGGSALQLLNAGGVSLNGQGLTLSGTVAGTNILVGGTPAPAARTVKGPGTFSVTGGLGGGDKSVTSADGRTLLFDTGVAVVISKGMNFGAGGLTTVNGSLVITTGGFVNTNAPVYGTGSTLVYDCTCVYTRGAEWSAASGPGHPFNVTVSDGSGTDLNLGANSPAAMRGSLLVNSSGGLNLDASDLQLGGNFTVNGFFTHNNRAVTFNGTTTQTVGGASLITFFHFVTAPGASVTAATSFNVAGNWTNNGAYNGNTETVTFNGPALQNIGGANPTNFNNLSVQTSAGVTLSSGQNVNGNLDLAAGNITTGANVITQPATASAATGGSTGEFDVIGNVRRTGFVNTVPLNFGNPNTRIAFNTGTPPSEVTVNLVKSRPAGIGFGFPNAVNRTYTITPTGGAGYTATLRLHYKDGELFGSPVLTEETLLDLWRFSGTVWQRVLKTNAFILGTNDNWVESSNVTQFSPWTLSATPLAPTVTRLRTLRATPYPDGTLVEWQTSYEADNLGFNLYRERDGRRTLLTPSPVAGSALVAGAAGLASGNSYSWVDRGGDERARYWLEDIDTDGRVTRHGPFSPASKRAKGRLPVRPRSPLLEQLGATGDARDARDTQTQWMPAATLTTRAALNGVALTTNDGGDVLTTSPNSGSSVERQRELAARPAVKLSVQRPGWYRVTRAALEAAGLGANALPTHLQLYADGVEQAITVNEAAWLAGAGAVEFYGEGLDTVSTDTRVYWLVAGDRPGRRTPSAALNATAAPVFDAPSANDDGDIIPTPEPPPVIIIEPPVDPNATPDSFAYTVERRDRDIYFSSLLNGEEENFFGRVVNPSAAAQAVNVRDLDAVSSAQVNLAVAVQGVTAVPHEVRVTFNGTEVGVLSFAGREHKQATFSVSPVLVREGENDVRLTSSAPSDVSLTDYIRLTYMRRYRAEGDALRFPAAGGGPLRVNGFTSPDIRVVDITDPSNVEDVPAVVEQEDDLEGSGYAVRFTPRADTGARRLLAFTSSSATAVSTVAPNQPSNLNDEENAADLVVLTHRDFRDAVAPLVARREQEGLTVKVVDVEDVFDEFSYGAHTPQAVKDFFAAARTSWARAPRYALLVGDGSYDPRDRMRRGAFDFIPSKLVDATHLETASDDWFVDFDGDDLADIALGRLPVRTAAEATVVTNKLVAYTPANARAAAVTVADVGSSRVDLQACKLEYSIVSPK